MFQTRKSFIINNTISSLPFGDLGEACKAVGVDGRSTEVATIVDQFGESFGIKSKPWVYPQLFARVGKWTLSRSESGKYDSKRLLADNCSPSPTDMGIYYFLMSDTRFVVKQYSEGRDFCALVPLIPAALRKMAGIKYYEWDSIDRLVNPKLREAMHTEYFDYTVDELLDARAIGLTVKSGKSANQVKSPVSTFGLNGVPQVINRGDVAIEGLGTLPPLVRMMLCQTWCAHPNNRTPYMILDPRNWETMPTPLVAADVLAPKQDTQSESLVPW